MYQALNKRVIAIPQDKEVVTSSGIVLSNDTSACVPYKVVFTNELTKDLQGKTVYAEARWLNYKLPKAGLNGETYVVIQLDDILAVSHE